MREPWALVTSAAELPAEDRATLAGELRLRLPANPEWALLETCHRVELYGFGSTPEINGVRALEGRAAVRRLLRVAAGIDSAVAGEAEVLHQVRDTLAEARARSGFDARLARLFESAIAVGHRVRAGGRPVRGLADLAVEWLSSRTPLEGRTVLVAGTGVIGSKLARAAASAGAKVTAAGRNPRPGALDLGAAAPLAPEAAGLLVALAGPWSQLKPLAGRLPPIADLSAPSAVPAEARQELGDDFLGIDDLYRRGAADPAWLARAERAVEAAVADYCGWLDGRRSVAAIQALRERAEARRRARVERLLHRLPGLPERERELVVELSHRLVTDVLHEPLSELRADTDGSTSAAAQRLFRL